MSIATSAFVTGGPVLATSAAPGRITGQVGASMEFNISNHLDLKVSYDLQIKSKYTN